MFTTERGQFFSPAQDVQDVDTKRGVEIKSMDSSDNKRQTIFDLCALDKEVGAPALLVHDPVYESVLSAIRAAFKNGGYVELRVVRGCSSYVRELAMKALPGQYRLIALTDSDDPKKQIMEWWESESIGSKGTVQFGDDEWDARAVCTDCLVAEKIFGQFLSNGDLVDGLKVFRSNWDPQP